MSASGVIHDNQARNRNLFKLLLDTLFSYVKANKAAAPEVREFYTEGGRYSFPRRDIYSTVQFIHYADTHQGRRAKLIADKLFKFNSDTLPVSDGFTHSPAKLSEMNQNFFNEVIDTCLSEAIKAERTHQESKAKSMRPRWGHSTFATLFHKALQPSMKEISNPEPAKKWDHLDHMLSSKPQTAPRTSL